MSRYLPDLIKSKRQQYTAEINGFVLERVHLYQCDNCHYRSNDDRIGAMNIQLLGTLYTTGNKHPKFVRE